MPDKEYYVYIPGSTEPTVLSANDYEAKKDKLFNTYKDANVVEMQGFNEGEDVGNSDFFINIPGSTAPTQISAADFAAKQDKIRAAYPDAQISRIRQVNYWGDKWRETEDRINALEDELKGIPEDVPVAGDPRAIQGGSVAGMQKLMVEKQRSEAPNRERRGQINREIEQLKRDREENPAWQQYWAQQGKENDDARSRIDKMRAEHKETMQEHSMDSALAAFDEDYLDVADRFYRDAKKIIDVPSKYAEDGQSSLRLKDYWQGIKDTGWSALSLVDFAQRLKEIPFLETVKKIQRSEGEDDNVYDLVKNHPDRLYEMGMGDAEVEMMKAFVHKADVESGKQDVLSRSYQAGQSMSKSLGYMLDFIAFGGIGDAAAKKVAGGLIENAGRRAVPKLAAETFGGLAKAAAMTPLMPSTYANFIGNLEQFNDAGGIDLSGKALLKDVGDILIENVSETVGAKPLELIGLPLQKVKFPDWAKAFRNTPVAGILKQAGYNGFFEEMFEEWTGSALRAMTGVDKDALKDFKQVDQLLVTAGSFAPVALFGGAATTAQFHSASKAMREKGLDVDNIIAGLQDENAKAAVKASFDATRDIETPEDFAHAMTDVYKQIVDNGGNEEQAFKAVMDYTEAASRYKVMNGMFEEQKDVERSQKLLEMDQQMGNANWHHYGDNGASYVRTITDEQGNERFVVAENDGELALVDRNGNNSFLTEENLNEGVNSGTLTDSGETPLFRFLDNQSESEKKQEEQVRMAAESNAAMQELQQRAQPGVEINVGTVENPIVGTIRGFQAGEYIVQMQDGSVRSYTPEAMANTMGIRLTPETDEEIEAKEIAQEERRATLRKDINGKRNQTFVTPEGKQYTILGVTKGDAEKPFVLYVKDEEEHMEAQMLTEEELSSIASSVQPAVESVDEVVQDSNPTVQVADDVPRDFRGNPLPLRTNSVTGEQEVDSNALWNEDPEAWVRWNDTNPDQDVTSDEKLDYNIDLLTKKYEEGVNAIKEAALSGAEQEQIDALKAGQRETRKRLTQLEGIKAGRVNAENAANSSSADNAVTSNTATPVANAAGAAPAVGAESNAAPATAEEILASTQAALDAVDQQMAQVRSAEDYRLAMEAKAEALQQMFDALGAENTVVSTRADIVEVFRAAGGSEANARELAENLRLTAGKERLRGFYNNGKVFIIADDIRGAEDANVTQLHEAKHLENAATGAVNEGLRTGVTEDEMRAAVFKRTGTHFYDDKSRRELVDEVLANAEEIAEREGVEAIPQRLAEAGIVNGEFINFVQNNINNGRRGSQRRHLGGRHALQSVDSEVSGREDVRDTQPQPAAVEGQGLRPDAGGEQGAGGAAEQPAEPAGERAVDLNPVGAPLSEEVSAELREKGLVMDGGAIMDEAQDTLKQETGYKTPNERDTESDPIVGDISYSLTTIDPWARNYLTHPDAKQHVVLVMRNLAERMAADELVYGVVPKGEYKYGQKSSGSKAGPLRTNIEYIVTFDMDTSCPRSLQYLEYVKKIEAQIGRPLTMTESVQLIEMMRVYGQMIPCVYCYCENKRQALKQYYTDFMTARHGVISAKTEEEALAAMYGHKTTKEAKESKDPAVVLNDAAYRVFQQWRQEKQYNPTIRQLWSQYRNDRNVILNVLDAMLDGGQVTMNNSDEDIAQRLCEELRISDKNAQGAAADIVSEWKWNRIEDRPHDDFFTITDEDDLVVDEKTLAVWREMTLYGKSASQAKNVLRYVPYTDELKTLSQADRDYINGMGGLRMHSSNDFRIDYVLDYFQFMADMAAYRMKGHTYTKSPEFVRIFGNSGYKINMSIAAYEDSRGVRPNPDEGFDWETARQLRQQFPNAGTMLMATSDAQIQFALDNDWIDMCIPFHASGLPKAVWYNMREWTDYSSTQNERFLNGEEMRAALVADGVEIPKDAKAVEIRKMYDENFRIRTYVAQSGPKKGQRFAPHFLPGRTTQNGVNVPGHDNDYYKYIELCRQAGVHPRFYGLKVKDNTPAGGGREVDITEHPRYMIFIKETARTDTPQTPVQFNFDQPSEALGGISPIDYAMQELQARAMAESEMAGSPVNNIYESYKQDTFGIVPKFIEGIIKHKEETGRDLPIDYLTPDSREWFMTERRAMEEAYKDFDTIPYHPHEYDADGNLIMEDEGIRTSVVGGEETQLTDAQRFAYEFVNGTPAEESPAEEPDLHTSMVGMDALEKDGVVVDNEAMLNEYGLSHLTLTKKGDVVTVNRVEAAEQGQGAGTRFMNELAAEADKNGWTLALTPDDTFGATSVNRLKKFYKRFGFKENKGSNTDFTINESMVRIPNGIRYSIEQEEAEKTNALFDAAKERFGTTRDIREAGYVLPDGTMLDFSGRHWLAPGSDSSYLAGDRQVDHRDIADLEYERDGNTPTGIETSMPDFIRRGAIRINDGSGASINLAVKPTPEQASVLTRLIEHNNGDVYLDLGDGERTDASTFYEGAKARRVINDIKRYFDEGVAPEGGINFSIRGILGAAEDETAMANLDTAKQMEADGKDAKTIWLATGWEKGADGKWRNEIPDATPKPFGLSKRSLKVEDIVDAPELFASYPEMKDYKVSLKKMSGAGSFNPKEKEIEMDRDYNTTIAVRDEDQEAAKEYFRQRWEEDPTHPADIRKDTEKKYGVRVLDATGLRTVMHELQHAIQDIEGFARGGNSKAQSQDYLSAAYKRIPEVVTFARAFSSRNSAARLLRYGRAKMINYIDRNINDFGGADEREMITALRDYLSGTDDYGYRRLVNDAAGLWKIAKEQGNERYNRLAGEVEARNVERRMGLTEEQRRETPISATEDVAREEQGVRFSVSADIAAKYPNWMDNQTTTEVEGSKRGQNTQVAGTVGTYKKVGSWIDKNIGKDAQILDASSGLGLGTLELRKEGFQVDDIEPYPGRGREEQPTYGGVDAYQQAMDDGKEYDYIISNAVLNVIPDDWRDGVLHDMATLLKPGGRMFINTRKAGEEKTIKNKIELESPQEVLVGTPERITSYQRFFTPSELKDYVEKELGDGYTVEIANEKNSGTKGLAAVVVTKAESPRFSVTDRDGNPIGDGSWHVQPHISESITTEYPQVKARVDEALSTESSYVTYTNTENGKSVKVRFSNHSSNAERFGDVLNGMIASDDEILYRLGLAEREFIPNPMEEKTIFSREISKKDYDSGKYEEADKTIQELYELPIGTDISEYKGKLAKGSRRLLQGDSVERNPYARGRYRYTRKAPDDIRFSVAYHGSPADFTEFEEGHYREGTGSFHRPGFYFASDEKSARPYAYDRGNGAFLYEVELPDDDGTNYIHVFKTIPKSRRREIAERINDIFPDKEINVERDVVNKAIAGEDLMKMFTNDELEQLGFVGVEGPMGIATMPQRQYIMFNPKDIKMKSKTNVATGDTIRFSVANENQSIFVSNAENAVRMIQMGKATPEQWQKMIEKNGGLKAGEDKWLGLSDWLKASDRKSITKQEILDFIDQNKIRIEETRYGGSLEDDIRERIGHGKSLEELQQEIDEIRDSAARFDAIGENPSDEEMDDYLYDSMVEEYGDDFKMGYRILDGEIDYNVDPYIDEEYAETYDGPLHPINMTRLSYTTDGLGNKREIALTVPTIEPWNQSDRIHFGDAGEGRAVAWVRFGDAITRKTDPSAEEKYWAVQNQAQAIVDKVLERNPDASGESMSIIERLMTPEEREAYIPLNKAAFAAMDVWRRGVKDKRVLFIDEIQSKRHQEGREKGYSPVNLSEYQRAIDYAFNQRTEYFNSLREKYSIKDAPVYDLMTKFEKKATREEFVEAARLNQACVAAMDAFNKASDTGIPAAPFEKNWHELAMKRMLRLAAEEGYDYVAWTKGEQQAERYSLSKVITGVQTARFPNEPDVRYVYLIQDGAPDIELHVNEEGVVTSVGSRYFSEYEGEKLSDIIGKELAVKTMATETDNYGNAEVVAEGEDLKIGGEGMKGFYDDILPRFVNKYAKKWGVKVEDINLPNLESNGITAHAIPVTEEMKESVMEGQLMFSVQAVEEQGNDVEYDASINAMKDAASEVAAKCGIGIEYKPSQEMQLNGKPLAGKWVNGRMYVCLEHCRDEADAVRTVLHEGVGHNGLRRLVGNENMSAFCLDMFNRLPETDRREIASAAVNKYGGNIAEAVEEHLAEKAETMDFDDDFQERSFWDVVRDGVRSLLAKVGINVPMSERDIRWLMWQSYNANKQGDILNEAKRQTVANKLGFTLRQQADVVDARQSERNRFAEQDLAPAARLYNKDVMNWMNRLHETWVDKDNSIKILVDSLEKVTGSKAKAFEDVRLALNQQSSKGLAAIEKFEREHYNPMMDAIKALMKAKGCDLKAVERYVMIKHGLERNEVFAKRDAREYYQKVHDDAVSTIRGSKTIEAEEKERLIAKEDEKLQRRLSNIEAGTDLKYKELRNQDYGGLTAMYSEFDPIEPFQEGVESEEEYNARVLNARHPKYTFVDENGHEQVDMRATEAAAEEETSKFEEGFGKEIDELWKRINGATKATLKHQYDSNMMSRQQYLAVRDMFQYYVPLRGFAENTAGDMYDYYQSDQRNSFTPPLQKAKGRKTESESPFGYIGAMASSGIAADMKNETKLSLYYFVSNRAANDLVTISDVWYEKTGEDEDGKEVFTPVYPPLTEDLSSEEAKKAYEDWENSMKEKAKTGIAVKGTNKLDLHNSVIHIDDRQKASHVIKFKVGGRDMMMFINGNPRAAQAINNELNVEMSTDYQKVFGKVLRWFSGINTSYNPEFWLSNAQRDLLFAIMSVNVKENPEYNSAFKKNLGRLLRKTLTPGAKNGAYSLKKKLDSGELGDAKLDRLYKEFVENGAVTGYTVLKNNEEWELELRKYTGEEKKVVQGIKNAFEKVQNFGEAIEQMTRFAAYITSREQGKDIKDSVNDAKELTVNFNRKGSGKAISFKEAEKLRTKDGKKLNAAQKAFVVGASWLPVYGRRFIMFFNAAVQGLNAMYKLVKKNPGKLAAWTAGYLTLGAMQAAAHALLDDDDDYLDIPDYERRNNLLIGGNGGYFKWALPQESRVFYAIGDMAVNHMLGREPHKSMLSEVLLAAADIAPLNPAGGISALAPSAITPVIEVILNRDYKGSKIYNDLKYLSDEERKRTPAYQKAYTGTGKVYVAMSQFANWLSGGDYADAGWININPAAVEHIMKGATGGAGTTLGKLYRGTVGQVLGEEFMVRNTPFISRLFTVTDERYRNAHTTELFDYYKAEAEHTKKMIRTYQKNGDDKRLNRIMDSDDYEIMSIYESYRKLLEWYNDELKATTDKKDRKALMREQDAVRKDMILEISEIK